MKSQQKNAIAYYHGKRYTGFIVYSYGIIAVM